MGRTAGLRCAAFSATEVVDFQPGHNGFGDSRLPDIVLGPPMGGGEYSGGIDVLSLGVGGEITLGFGPRECIDGPGVDFIVFESFSVARN